MAATIITINFPFPYNEKNSQEFKVTSYTPIKNIIQSLLPNNCTNLDEYGIYVRPQNKWLLPELLLKNYQHQLTSPSAIYEFRSKSLKKIKINILFNQISTYCDPRQPIGIVVKNAAAIINPSHASSDFSIEDMSGNCFGSSEPIENAIQSFNTNSIPIIRARREISQNSNNKLIFKGTIDNALSREPKKVNVPSFFTKLLELIDEHRDSVGIYRLSGDFTIIEEICQHIENSTDEEELNSYLSQQRPNELACVVKQYLRQLSEPVIPPFFEKDFRETICIEDFAVQIQKLKVLIKSLPFSHYSLFLEFCRHIERVIESPVNQMGSKNLAICIGTNILRAQNPTTVVQDTQSSQLIVQVIFENWRFLFLDEELNLNENKGTLICDVTDPENGKTLKEHTKVLITERPFKKHENDTDNDNNEGDEIWTVKSGDISLKTNSNNIQLDNPQYVTPFDDFIFLRIDSFVSERRYLVPDHPKRCLSTIGVKEQIIDRINEAKDIGNKLDEILEKLSKDPNNQALNMEFERLKDRFTQI